MRKQKQQYVITHGEYSDYGIVAILVGPVANLTELWETYITNRQLPRAADTNEPDLFLDYLCEHHGFARIRRTEYWYGDRYCGGRGSTYRSKRGLWQEKRATDA